MTTKLVEHFQKLDRVIHDFMDCLAEWTTERPVDSAGAANVARFRRILEQTPPAGSPVLGPPVLCGVSERIGMESVLGFLGSLRKTGMLRVRAGSTSFMISIVKGDVVHGVSNPRPASELLGNILLARGVVRPVDLQRFFERCGPSALSIVDAVNREQLVGITELRAALEQQMQQLFDRLLATEEAEWCFHEGEVTLSYINMRMNVTSVLLESLRKHDERKNPVQHAPGSTTT